MEKAVMEEEETSGMNDGDDNYQFNYDQYEGSGGSMGERNSTYKSNRDDFLSGHNLANTRLFDQDLRKNLRDKMIEKTYIKLRERFNTHLKGKMKDTLLNSLDKAIEAISK